MRPTSRRPSSCAREASDAPLTPAAERPGDSEQKPPGRRGAAVVAAISTTAVKGFGLSSPAAVYVDLGGVFENRRFVVVDRAGAALTGPRHGALLRWRADYDAGTEHLRLRRPDGTVVTGAVGLGRPLRLEIYSGTVDARIVIGPWGQALTADLGTDVDLARVEPGSSASDVAPVSLVSTASLSRLSGRAGEDVDGRRFRMLFTLDGCGPHEEDRWAGQALSLGEARVRVAEPVGRCAMTSLDPTDGARSRNMVKVIKSYRGVSDRRTVDFGMYATVERPGTVRVGDPVEYLRQNRHGGAA